MIAVASPPKLSQTQMILRELIDVDVLTEAELMGRCELVPGANLVALLANLCNNGVIKRDGDALHLVNRPWAEAKMRDSKLPPPTPAKQQIEAAKQAIAAYHGAVAERMDRSEPALKKDEARASAVPNPASGSLSTLGGTTRPVDTKRGEVRSVPCALPKSKIVLKAMLDAGKAVDVKTLELLCPSLTRQNIYNALNDLRDGSLVESFANDDSRAHRVVDAKQAKLFLAFDGSPYGFAKEQKEKARTMTPAPNPITQLIVTTNSLDAPAPRPPYGRDVKHQPVARQASDGTSVEDSGRESPAAGIGYGRGAGLGTAASEGLTVGETTSNPEREAQARPASAVDAPQATPPPESRDSAADVQKTGQGPAWDRRMERVLYFLELLIEIEEGCGYNPKKDAEACAELNEMRKLTAWLQWLRDRPREARDMVRVELPQAEFAIDQDGALALVGDNECIVLSRQAWLSMGKMLGAVAPLFEQRGAA